MNSEFERFVAQTLDSLDHSMFYLSSLTQIVFIRFVSYFFIKITNEIFLTVSY